MKKRALVIVLSCMKGTVSLQHCSNDGATQSELGLFLVITAPPLSPHHSLSLSSPFSVLFSTSSTGRYMYFSLLCLFYSSLHFLLSSSLLSSLSLSHSLTLSLSLSHTHPPTPYLPYTSTQSTWVVLVRFLSSTHMVSTCPL